MFDVAQVRPVSDGFSLGRVVFQSAVGDLHAQEGYFAFFKGTFAES